MSQCGLLSAAGLVPSNPRHPYLLNHLLPVVHATFLQCILACIVCISSFPHHTPPVAIFQKRFQRAPGDAQFPLVPPPSCRSNSLQSVFPLQLAAYNSFLQAPGMPSSCWGSIGPVVCLSAYMAAGALYLLPQCNKVSQASQVRRHTPPNTTTHDSRAPHIH